MGMTCEVGFLLWLVLGWRFRSGRRGRRGHAEVRAGMTDDGLPVKEWVL